MDSEIPPYVQKQNLNTQIFAIDAEITSIDTEIENLKKLRGTLKSERDELLKQLGEIGQPNRTNGANPSKIKQPTTGINYNEEFDWSEPMKARMKAVFGIENFRLCQEAYVFSQFKRNFS